MPEKIKTTAILLAIENNWRGVINSFLKTGPAALFDAFKVCHNIVYWILVILVMFIHL